MVEKFHSFCGLASYHEKFPATYVVNIYCMNDTTTKIFPTMKVFHHKQFALDGITSSIIIRLFW